MRPRAERIAEARQRRDAAAEALRRPRYVYEQAQEALYRATSSFEVGETVLVRVVQGDEDTVVDTYYGTVASEDVPDTRYNIRDHNGNLHMGVWHGYLTRLPVKPQEAPR